MMNLKSNQLLLTLAYNSKNWQKIDSNLLQDDAYDKFNLVKKSCNKNAHLIVFYFFVWILFYFMLLLIY